MQGFDRGDRLRRRAFRFDARSRSPPGRSNSSCRFRPAAAATCDPHGRGEVGPGARRRDRHRKPARRRDRARRRSRLPRRAGRQHARHRRQLVHHPSELQEAELRPADELRAGLPACQFAAGHRRQQLVALQDAHRMARCRARQARRAVPRQRRPSEPPAHRLRAAQAAWPRSTSRSCRSTATRRR